MGGDTAVVRRARDAASRSAWTEVYELLHTGDVACSPEDHEALSDAAWWLCRVEESLAARQKAYAGYVDAGDARRAGYNAWMLSTEYQYVGKASASAGWLEKARRHLRDEAECVEQGYVVYSDAEAAEVRGDLDEALTLARQMTEIGTRCASRDVVAMGLQLQGRLLVAQGEVDRGLALLDEAMADVVAGSLSDLVTGWIYCIAVAVCFEIADVRRATEWNDAAMAWCASLPSGTPFHGICRVHHVELMGLAGAWAEADAEVARACDELMAYHPNMAAESYYVAGELRRRMGDLAAAEEAFVRAHELGREPQPGLALVRLAQGKADDAAIALRACVADGAGGPLGRARLLAATVEVALAAADPDEAAAAAAELAAISSTSGAALLDAMAATSQGAVQLAREDWTSALASLRRARSLWLELGLPYEAAQARVLLADANRAAGDDEGARLELRAARAVFERLGSTADVARVDAMLGEPEALPARLTEREAEVLRLVAAGRTNRAIADELVISEHTVARHLNNIFAKLGVSSRAAATAFAYTHNLL